MAGGGVGATLVAPQATVFANAALTGLGLGAIAGGGEGEGFKRVATPPPVR
jgi:hypothetical protein